MSEKEVKLIKDTFEKKSKNLYESLKDKMEENNSHQSINSKMDKASLLKNYIKTEVLESIKKSESSE